MSNTSYNVLVTTCSSALAFIAFWGVQRLFFHPLSRFPGPPLAALTLWYKAYYDIIMDGGWSTHLDYLHEKHGSVVRVAPNELHFNDPHAYGDIYGSGSKFTKQPELYSCFATDLSVFALFDMHEALQRRNLIGPFFSRQAIMKLENVVQTQVDTLITRLLTHPPTKKPANLDLAFRATSLEVITAYCFGIKADPLVSEDFQNDILSAMDATLPMIWVFKHFPFIKFILLNVPEWTAAYLKPSTLGIIEQRRQMGAQIDGFLKDPTLLENVEHETIYHYLLTPQPENHRLPPVSRTWLLDEGLYLRFAGSDTVGNVSTVGAYYILSNPKIHATLVEELEDAWPDRDAIFGHDALEKLPYLTAVIKESLRMAHGVITPLPRIVGPTDAEISGEIVPAGTVVAMGAAVVHRNPGIFPEPETFSPDRWLQPDSHELDRYLVSFSKGPRSCLGINLAWCELYLIFGNVFRKLTLEPVDATVNNISFREYFVGVHRGSHLQAHVKLRSS
ncbi:cytochrome P450 [Collybia nuda]|uniref:Cytochrome P450 n=1 Tax=Collybia nuda TaxID=64659 RepID=A0A9P6CM35_9AGAR|nr:cytochrome P450 [Collybia nuda]